MKITYREVNGYLIPNLKLPPEEANIRLGKWGMVYKDYLENNKKVFFNMLLMQGKLYQNCAEVEKQARYMYDMLIEQMKMAEGVTEQLKEDNQMEWIQRMGNIEARAREMIQLNLFIIKNSCNKLKVFSQLKNNCNSY
ncbi:MAG: TnpV protein [Clostridia bacterium]|nr:TnpV protein [Clostridia bacterium]